MTLKIKQGAKYQGDEYWDWWVSLDGPKKDLEQVDKVVYTLHRTFPNPVRTVESKENNFKLETAGWGTFRINAQVHMKDGEKIKLQHDLVLNYPDGTPTKA